MKVEESCKDIPKRIVTNYKRRTKKKIATRDWVEGVDS